MSIKKTALIIIFIVFTSYLAYLLYEKKETSNTKSFISTDNIEVLFFPKDNNKLKVLLMQDYNKIHCAVFSIKYDFFIKKIANDLDKNKDIVIITDNKSYYNNLKSFDKNTLKALKKLKDKNIIIIDNYSLMHNKFCILDDILIIGSKNFTNSMHYDNMLIIKDKNIVKEAEEEIKEMKKGIFKGGEKSKTDGIAFCPEDNCLDIYLKYAKKSKNIDCAFFSFTLSEFADAIKEKNYRVIFYKGQINKYSQYYNLKDRSYISKKYMHNKFCIFDKKTVITGSMNMSKNGTNRNDESIVIINNKEIANKFSDYFDEMLSIAIS